MNRFFFLGLSILLILVSPLSAIDLEAAVPEEYTLGICSLRGIDIEREQRFFLHSIPSLYLDSLSGIPDHRLTDEEKQSMEEYIVSEALDRLREEAGTLIRQRDALFFEKDAGRGQSIQASLERKREEIAGLEAGQYESAELPDSLPLALVKENMQGDLLEPPGVFLKQYCQDRGIDFLVTGSLEGVDDFFYLTTEVYNRFTDSVIFRESTACSSRELAARAEGIIPGLTSAVLGRPWAELRVQTTPPSASIYLEGTFSGAGILYKPYIRPGTYILEARAPGYESKRLEIELEPEQQETFHLKLPERVLNTFVVETDPPGADIYLSSMWVGKSPVAVAYPGKPAQLVAVKEGHKRIFTILSEAPGERVFLTLQPETPFDYDIREDFRNNFYRDFGLFVVSIPFTLVGYSLAEQYSIALSQADSEGETATEKYYRLWRTARLCYNLYSAGLYANTFLFIHAAVSAAEYIGRAGPPSGE